MIDIEFFRNKKVLVTGHTGFKGSWLCQILTLAGANVQGYSLLPETVPNLFDISSISKRINSKIGDIRDFKHLLKCIKNFEPEIVFHLAAQPLVRESYANPVYTYETNIMGTVNILEAARHCKSVKSLVVVTTDKVYRNMEWSWGYRENDALDGYDPYSNSKSCAELVTSSYRRSFFQACSVAISTVRAGNVIGGGDFSKDRIIPDCIKAAVNHEPIVVRNPYSTRPYQHVLEPLFAYLMIAEKQYEMPSFADNYNIGPEVQDCVTTGSLASIFCKAWGEEAEWINTSTNGPHEANFLKLDCSKIKTVMSWQPRWHIEQAVQRTVDWTKLYRDGQNVVECMNDQICEYMSGTV